MPPAAVSPVRVPSEEIESVARGDEGMTSTGSRVPRAPAARGQRGFTGFRFDKPVAAHAR
jgi:hypothetical protein